MARLDHVALYTRQLEVLRDFYITYFQASSNDKYINPRKGFESYFLRFKGEARLEIMRKEGVETSEAAAGEEYLGLTHLALSVGDKVQVDTITERLRAAGYTIAGEPRNTGDGYYESVVLDPDGNRVEIVAE
jgi:lactoylglutathione lyase